MDIKAHAPPLTLEPATEPVARPDSVEQFIGRWRDTGGTERANYQIFLTELCELLDLPRPNPAIDDTPDNAYVFERRITIRPPDGSKNRGYIDLYRRGCFVLEAKQTGKSLNTRGWDKAMLAAQNQANQYVRALPGYEGRPPFIVVTDVCRSMELCTEFFHSDSSYCCPLSRLPNHPLMRMERWRRRCMILMKTYENNYGLQGVSNG